MEILGVQYATTGPVGTDLNIRVCSKCKAILKYDYHDIFVKKLMGYDINYINCKSCGTELTVSEVQR